MLIKYLKTTAIICLFWSMGIVFNSIMDWVHFRPPGGFWSIGDGWDAWHISKQLMYLSFAIAIVWNLKISKILKFIIILLIALLTHFVHEFLFHGILP
jgi:hypothetical protein